MKTNEKCVSNWLSRGLCAIIPVYDDNGCNGSRLLFQSSPPLTDNRKVKTIVRELAAYYQKTPELIKRHAMSLTGLRTMNPLPVAADMVLLPFKARKPVGINDGAVGYIFLKALSDVIGCEDGSTLVLRDDTRICVLENINTIKRRLKTANMMCKAMGLMSGFRSGENMLAEAEAQYNEPATKGDIYLLSRNMNSFISLFSYFTDEKPFNK